MRTRASTSSKYRNSERDEIPARSAISSVLGVRLPSRYSSRRASHHGLTVAVAPQPAPVEDVVGGGHGAPPYLLTVLGDNTYRARMDLLLDSLRRRMRAMHSLYEDAIATMDLSHVNHFEREGVLPIAFCLFHYTNMQDVSSSAADQGQPPVWNDDWQARVQMAINDHGKERTVGEMIHQRIGDYEAFGEYQRAVFARTEAWLAGLDPGRAHPGDRAPPAAPGGGQHLQRPGGRRGRHHRARRHRVLDLPARPAPHG